MGGGGLINITFIVAFVVTLLLVKMLAYSRVVFRFVVAIRVAVSIVCRVGLLWPCSCLRLQCKVGRNEILIIIHKFPDP